MSTLHSPFLKSANIRITSVSDAVRSFLGSSLILALSVCELWTDLVWCLRRSILSSHHDRNRSLKRYRRRTLRHLSQYLAWLRKASITVTVLDKLGQLRGEILFASPGRSSKSSMHSMTISMSIYRRPTVPLVRWPCSPISLDMEAGAVIGWKCLQS